MHYYFKLIQLNRCFCHWQLAKMSGQPERELWIFVVFIWNFNHEFSHNYSEKWTTIRWLYCTSIAKRRWIMDWNEVDENANIWLNNFQFTWLFLLVPFSPSFEDWIENRSFERTSKLSSFSSAFKIIGFNFNDWIQSVRYSAGHWNCCIRFVHRKSTEWRMKRINEQKSTNNERKLKQQSHRHFDLQFSDETGFTMKQIFVICELFWFQSFFLCFSAARWLIEVAQQPKKNKNTEHCTFHCGHNEMLIFTWLFFSFRFVACSTGERIKPNRKTKGKKARINHSM